MRARILLNVFAVLVGVTAFLAALISMANTNVVPGVTLAYEDGQVVIATVDYGSAAQRYGIVAGMVVVTLDGQDILDAPDSTKRSIGDTTGVPGGSGLSVISREEVPGYLSVLAQARAEGSAFFWSDAYSFYRIDRFVDLFPVGLGLFILIGGWWWLGSGRAGPSLRRFAVTLPVAAAVPMFVLPIDQLPAMLATGVGAVLLPAGLLPLGLDLAAHIEARRWVRWLVGLAAVGLAVATAAAGFWVPSRFVTPGLYEGQYEQIRVILASLVVLVPGYLAAGPILRPSSGRPGGAVPRLVGSTELLVAAATPGVACLSLLWPDPYFLIPIVVWLGAIQARRMTLAPFVRLVGRATRQRDLVVAATEGERARIATDIHDFALQDLTMLVRRLDAAGDTANAEAAREVAERLRAICGDLRLPVLDDLGVGPALEWLCSRYEPTAGHIGLDRFADEKRLPADAELAFFRVAQESIANATRHGAPPILVRYRGGGSWAELEVDDSGAGLPPGAAELAETSGHLGLMTMTQRAEAIGAELSVGRRPGGGTRVRLVWEGTGGPAEAPEESVATHSAPAAAVGPSSPEPA
jgi:signal transduction histidine kinase